MPDPQIEAAIRTTAARHGIDPSLMMAIAERESSFKPTSGSGSPYSSAFGLYQLLRGERAKYGGNSTDPEEQAEAWANYIQPTRREMAGVLGRDPSGPETYLGHYFGGVRAARMLTSMHPDTPVDAVFTPRELAANPNIGRAGTVGALTGSVLGDIGRRQQKFGGGGAPAFGQASTGQASLPDFSEYAQGGGASGAGADGISSPPDGTPARASGGVMKTPPQRRTQPDFSSYAAAEAPDFSMYAEPATGV